MKSRLTQYTRVPRFVYAGALVGISFTHPFLWWCALPGLVLLAHIIYTAPTSPAAVRSAVGAGIVKSLIATAWLLDAYPADWLGDVARTEQFTFILMCWLGTGISLGMGAIALGWLGYASRTSARGVREVVFGCALVLSETLGAILFSLYALGPGSTLHAHFGFGMSGFLLAHHGLLLSGALIAGVYGLSFLLGVIASALVRLCTRKHYHYALAVFGVFVASSALPGPHAWTAHTAHEPLASVHTSFVAVAKPGAAERSSRLAAVEGATRAALRSGAKIVLLPEDARLGIDSEPTQTAAWLQRHEHAPGALVIDSYRSEREDGSAALRGQVYDIDLAIAYASEKQYMVPIGEFMPYFHSAIVNMLGNATLFGDMRYRGGATDFDTTTPPNVPHMLFCFESGATPVLWSRIAARDASLIAHPVSHAWFHDPHTLQNQERQMLIVQSVFTRIPILQAGNRAPSVLYLPDGTVDNGTVVAEGSRWQTVLFQ